MKQESRSLLRGYCNLLWCVALVYVLYFVCRVVFLAANADMFAGRVFGPDFWHLVHGSLVFDTSAICYGNILFAALALFPLHFKEGARVYAGVVKWAYVLPNALFLLSNLPDVVYVRYTGRRTTASVLGEFSHDSNIAGVLAAEALHSWWLVLLAVCLVFLLVRLYRSPLTQRPSGGAASLGYYYASRAALFAFSITFAVFGMRGGMTRDTRPITISNANQYVSSPVQAPLVLNTPFCIIRSSGHKAFVNPGYYASLGDAARDFNPLRTPCDSAAHFAQGRGKNVVVLIVESMAREYIGGYNKQFIGPDYRGYMPFIDSLLTQAMWCEQSFTNGRKSIDGMPSVLSSIPYFIEPFFLTTATLNDLDGLAVELAKDGYATAFFHGAPNGSMGFDGFAKATGFKAYYGMTEYCQDPGFGGKDDFDGVWAIWDEEFMQYFAKQMDALPQPFVTSIFTASNHHPFRIPERYLQQFPEEEMVINKCTRYTDMALRRFFEAAKRMPWYQNTIFVLCSDHVNMSNYQQYQTDLGAFTGPVIFYEPGNPQSPFRGRRDGVMQQIDVMPTLLNYLGHTQPYVAFGNDLLNTPPDSTWAVSYLNGFYQLVKHGYFFQFDGQKIVAVYALGDKLLQHNLLDAQPGGQTDGQTGEQTGGQPAQFDAMCQEVETQFRAMIQQYCVRMIENRLTSENEE